MTRISATLFSPRHFARSFACAMLVTSRLVSPKSSAMSQTGISMPIKPPEWITGRSFVPWAMPKGRVSSSGPARPSVSPFWRSAGWLRSNFVAAEPPGTEDHVPTGREPGECRLKILPLPRERAPRGQSSTQINGRKRRNGFTPKACSYPPQPACGGVGKLRAAEPRRLGGSEPCR